MKLRILAERDVRAVLDMAAAIDLQAEAFALLARGQLVQGLRGVAGSETPPGVTIFNPSYRKDGGGFGIKIVSDFAGNERLGLPRMSAVAVLFDGATGLPMAVMEAAHLTDLRTGAGTALAARHLARPDSRTVAIVGAGRVARNQLEGLSEVCPLERVRVATRSPARGRAFVERMRARGGRVPGDIELVGSAAEAVSAADIVVAATTSDRPVVEGAWLRPGTFVAAAGAFRASSREVDSETVRRAACRVIDSRADCLDRAGDLLIPISEGVIGRDQVAELSELVSGARPGRTDAGQIAFYKSSGVPVQDLVTAQYIARRAAERGIGTVVEIGGDHD